MSSIIEGNIEESFTKFGRYVRQQMRSKLTKAGKRSSNELYKSIDYEVSKKDLSVTVFAADYAKFVDEGVKGNESRLKRLEKGGFGSPEYAKEELIAEQGSAFIAMQLGLKHDKLHHNTAAYLQSWLKALKQDKRLIFKAASQAEKASRYLLDIHCEQALAA